MKKIITKCDFIIGSTSVDTLPNLLYPEIAIAGRSNVGKSSLINSITGLKRKAHVSSTPGRTRQLNFYLINNDFFTLVDLPGYGYSKASKIEIENYISLMEHYFKNRENLQLVVLLIDSRRSLKEIDMDFINWLVMYNINYMLVLTKIDKIKDKELEHVLLDISEKVSSLVGLVYPIIPISNKKNMGLERLIYEITKNIKKK